MSPLHQILGIPLSAWLPKNLDFSQCSYNNNNNNNNIVQDLYSAMETEDTEALESMKHESTFSFTRDRDDGAWHSFLIIAGVSFLA